MESNKALQKGGDETRLLKSIPNKKYFFTFTRTINSCSGYSVIFTAFLPSQRASVSRKEEHEEHYCVNKNSKHSGYEKGEIANRKEKAFSTFFSLSPLVVSREKTFFPRELVYLQLPLLVNPHSFFRGNYVIQYGFKYGITGTLREPIIASPSLQA